MNTNDLIIFQAVAHHGSINRAAQQLNYVQSNITSRIQKLELALNTKLFHRHKRGVTLTIEGSALLPYAEKITSLIEEMKQFTTSDVTPRGKIDIASVETVIKLPIILSAYTKKYKEVDLTLSTGVTTELKEKVLHHEFDGAFVTKSNAIYDTDLTEIEVFHEKLVIVSSEENSNLDYLMEQPILRFSDGCGYRAKLNEWLQDNKITPSKVMELGTLETTLGSVMSGLGIAYVPYSTIKDHVENKRIYYYELPKKYSQITTSFIYRKSNYIAPALKRFIETIEENKITESGERVDDL